MNRIISKNRTDHWILTMIDPGLPVPARGKQKARAQYNVYNKTSIFRNCYRMMKTTLFCRSYYPCRDPEMSDQAHCHLPLEKRRQPRPR